MPKPKLAKPSTYFSDHLRKQVIRSQWCKPQIDILRKKLNRKLIYIGLPDLKALDVKEWIEHLEKVIAFQCTEYSPGKRIKVEVLEELLVDLERKNLIKSSIVYHGWMEEIVMGGLSEIGQTYSQTEFLKIYNLDFCNNFTTPRKVYNERGKVIDIITKSQAIEMLLDYQKRQNGSKFLMYLTINSDTFNEDLSKLKEKPFKTYLKKIAAIRKPEARAVREMKAFCFHELKAIFQAHDFHVEFLPPVFYLGSDYPNPAKGGQTDYHRMMTFTILGTKKSDGQALFQQDQDDFLNRKFIWVTDKGISCYNDPLIVENAFDSDVNRMIQETHTYKNLWSV